MNQDAASFFRSGATVESLDLVFRPKSVALIGISANPSKLTGAPLRNLVKCGFKGRIYPINAKYKSISDLACYASVEDLPEAPDVALIMVSAANVPEIIRACGKKGTRAAVVLTSGFEESENGSTLAAELAAAAAESGVAVLGPNCEGVWSVAEHTVLSFGSAANRTVLHHAPVAIISQSGAVAGGVSRQLQNSGFGCSYVASVGNETCIDSLDVLKWVIGQSDVRVVLLFVEGLKNAARLLELSHTARRRGIQIVALKSGNSRLGQAAVASHTGKVASSYVIYRDIFERAGIVQVNGITELVEAAELFTSLPLPKDLLTDEAGVAIFSIPGGTRALTVDLCERYNVPLATFTKNTEEKLKNVLPPFAQVSNPTDLTGQVLSSPELFDECLTIVSEDPRCEALVIQLANRGPDDLQERSLRISEIASHKNIPVIVSFLGDTLPSAARLEALRRKMIPAPDPTDAVRYLDWLYTSRRNFQDDDTSPVIISGKSTKIPSDWEGLKAMMADIQIPLPAEAIVKVSSDIARAAASLKFPLVAKAFPDQADHKTELGLVELSIGSADALRSAIERLRSRLGNRNAPILVQEMAKGIEVVLSVIRDPDFGLLLAVGSGGTGIELWRDIAYTPAPASERSIRAMLGKLKLGTILRGFRGQPPADIHALAEAARRLSEYIASSGSAFDEIEINPLIIGPEGDGVVAVDILVRGRATVGAAI